MRLFTLCSYLKTKESYDSGLQGEKGDLDIKYLKKKIKKCRSQISGSTWENFVSVQDGCEILQPEGHHFAAKG